MSNNNPITSALDKIKEVPVAQPDSALDKLINAPNHQEAKELKRQAEEAKEAREQSDLREYELSWRKLGESTTTPMSNERLKEITRDPCDCYHDTIKAAGKKFKDDLKAYEIGKTTSSVYRDGEAPPKWRIATDAELKSFGLKKKDFRIKTIKLFGLGAEVDTPFRAQLFMPLESFFCEKWIQSLRLREQTLAL